MVGAVVLTYNSSEDLPECLAGLIAQTGVDLRLFVVDNASRPDERSQMETDFLAALPEGQLLAVENAHSKVVASSPAVFLRNEFNDGYSAGNNIGARLAESIGCETVLIVNPDVRVSNPAYVAALWKSMKEYPDCVMCASRILNIKGLDENPIRGIGFWEELFWIRQYFPFRPPAYVNEIISSEPIVADKLHGCCFMIGISFLEKIGFFDDSTFLYSEEPILAAQVRKAGKYLILFPHLSVVHAHVASAKGNSSRRMLIFIESRLYFLKQYAGYGKIQLAALGISYGALRILHMVKAILTDHRQGNRSIRKHNS